MNAGEKVLDRLYSRDFQCDAEWSIRKPNTFRWWAAEHAQTVWIEKEVSPQPGQTGYVVSIATDFIRGIKVPEHLVPSPLKPMMCFASMATPIWLPEKGEIRLVSKMVVHEQNWELAAVLLSHSGLLQIYDAKKQAHVLAELCEGVPNKSGPKADHLREPFDEMASAVEKLFVPLGKEKGKWTEQEFTETVEKYMHNPPCIMASGGGQGLTGEFVHGDGTSLFRIFGDEKHPWLGNGLVVTQMFPVPKMTENELIRMAIQLNQIEVVEGPWGYGFGSYWTKNDLLVHNAFYPNAAYLKGLLPNLYFSAANRAKHICKMITGKEWTSESFQKAWEQKKRVLGLVSEKPSFKERFRFRP